MEETITTEWIYTVDGTRRGPATASEIATSISSGQLPPDTLVWKMGLSGWVSAGDVPEIACLCAPPLPCGPSTSVPADKLPADSLQPPEANEQPKARDDQKTLLPPQPKSERRPWWRWPAAVGFGLAGSSLGQVFRSAGVGVDPFFTYLGAWMTPLGVALACACWAPPQERRRRLRKSLMWTAITFPLGLLFLWPMMDRQRDVKRRVNGSGLGAQFNQGPAGNEPLSEQQLSRVAAAINAQLPLKLDNETLHVNTVARPGVLVYVLRLVNYSRNQLPDAERLGSILGSGMAEGACAEAQTRPLLDAGVTLRWTYIDKEGQDVAQVEVHPRDCSAGSGRP